MEWYFGNMEMDCNLKRTELVMDFVFYFERSRTHELEFKSFIQIVQGFHCDIDEAVIPLIYCYSIVLSLKMFLRKA